jgi:hypothetical protein
MTILPDPSSVAPRLLCLRYYRVASTGWTFGSGCVSCQEELRPPILPFTSCVAPGEPCQCKICRRQPPTLKDLASHFMFTLTCNLERFEVTRDVTFRQYVYTVSSGRPMVRCVLTPGFPHITLSFRYRCCSQHPYHPQCAIDAPWQVSASRLFETELDAVRALCSYGEQYWRSFCEKILFLPVICYVHGAIIFFQNERI